MPSNERIDGRSLSRSLFDNNHHCARQSKLEDFGFDMLPRSSTMLRKQKTISHSLLRIQCSNKTKKLRTIE